MKTAIISLLIAGIATFTDAAETEKMELPKSGSVILTTTEGMDSIQYDVFLRSTSGHETKLSSAKVPRSAPVGSAWLSLLSCDENPEMVVVLLGTDPYCVILLQYDLITKAVKEERLFAGRLLEKRRETISGTLIVSAPNRITLADPTGKSQSWTVVDGKFFDENGAVSPQDEGFPGAVETSEPKPQAPPDISSPGTNSNAEPPATADQSPPKSEPATHHNHGTESSPPWISILVGIVAALGLLWMLIKRLRQQRDGSP